MIVTVHRPTCTCTCSYSEPAPRILLDHERLDAYRISDQLDVEVISIARHVPRGHAGLADQAQRASSSANLNLVEAMGRTGADRARILRIARGEALEVDAALTRLERRGACDATSRVRARDLTVRLVQMLVRLIAVAEGGGG
ncbi:MAG: four helix bundle protein [Planctomycetales bacterium]|nr:four helix bundle protein [Planctomycetales bacterium]